MIQRTSNALLLSVEHHLFDLLGSTVPSLPLVGPAPRVAQRMLERPPQEDSSEASCMYCIGVYFACQCICICAFICTLYVCTYAYTYVYIQVCI